MAISISFNNNNTSSDGKVSGPLAALYGNSAVTTSYRYPSDLGINPARRHSIVFTIKKPIPNAPLTDLGNGADFSGVAQDAKSGNYVSALQKAGDSVIAVGKNVADAATGFANNPSIGRANGTTIGLYIPDTVNVSYNPQYDDISVASSLGTPYFLAQGAVSLFDKYKQGGDVATMANKVAGDPYARSLIARDLGKLTNTDLTRLAINQQGLAANPQLQVLFRGVGFRQFQFDFVFTPYSAEESKQVQNIIKELKMAAAPKITPNQGFSQGLFLEVPNTLDVQFYYGARPNTSVHKIGECVITNMNVDYAPNGWSTFQDGSPTQIKLTLQLQETVIVDKNRIEEGY